MDKYMRVGECTWFIVDDGNGGGHQQFTSGDAHDVNCDADLIDAAEGVTAVDKAVELLQETGAIEYSASSWLPNGWYIVPDYVTNVSIGEYGAKSLRVMGFSRQESQEIYAKWSGRNVR